MRKLLLRKSKSFYVQINQDRDLCEIRMCKKVFLITAITLCVAVDGQGIIPFLRHGYTGSEKNDITDFWSFGLQCKDLFEGRDGDVLGLDYTNAVFSNNASATYTDNNEDVIEIYYNTHITPRLNVSPMVQYVDDPGGNDAAKDVTVFGLMIQ